MFVLEHTMECLGGTAKQRSGGAWLPGFGVTKWVSRCVGGILAMQNKQTSVEGLELVDLQT